MNQGAPMPPDPDISAAPGTGIVPADFPELARLVWNGDPRRPISGPDALALYERNWRHVDTSRLIPAERDLIRTLAEKYGRGFFLPQ